MESESEWVSLATQGFSKYQAHPSGKIKCVQTGIILNGNVNRAGYVRGTLIDDQDNKKGILFHRIIAFAFLPPPSPSEMTVDHINRKKDDNRIQNLRFASPKEQQQNIVRSSKYLKQGVPIIRVDEHDQEIARFPSARSAARHLIQELNLEFEDSDSLRRKLIRISFHIGQALCSHELYLGSRWIREKDLPTTFEEQWFPVPSHAQPTDIELEYSDTGRLRNKQNRRIVGNQVSLAGYSVYGGSTKKHFCHRIIAASIYGPIEEGKVVNHLDGNRSNNRPDNLQVVSQIENIHHASNKGNYSGPRNSAYRIRVKGVDNDGKEFCFESIHAAAVWLGNQSFNHGIRTAIVNSQMYRGFFWNRQ